MSLPPGYQILAELGRGGMGVVYQAREAAHGRLVALKVLREDSARLDESVRARMKRELRLMQGLRHPNLVPLIGGRLDHDPPYLVFDYLPGCQDLAKMLRTGSVRREHAQELVTGIARGLAYLHARGIVHRDVKPGNVLVDAAGVPRVIDFGLARRTASQDTVLTQEGQTFGSLPYMAPEQIETADVDHRADVYSFGLMAYEILVGRPVFAGVPGSVITLTERLRGDIPPLSGERRDLEPAWARAVMRCLIIDPEERTGSMRWFLTEIGVTDITDEPEPEPEPAPGPAPDRFEIVTEGAAPGSAPGGRARAFEPEESPQPRVAGFVAGILFAMLLAIWIMPAGSPRPAATPERTTQPDTSTSLNHLVTLSTELSASPAGTIQQLKAAVKAPDRATRLARLVERWGLDTLARDPILAPDRVPLAPEDELLRSIALLRLDHLDTFCQTHGLPPLLGRPVDELLPPGLRRAGLPAEPGWTFRQLTETNVREGKPLSLSFTMEDPGALTGAMIFVAGLNLFPEFLLWFRLNDAAAFSLDSDKRPPFEAGGATEDADRRELARAIALAPFLLWRAKADLDDPHSGVEAAGVLGRGLPPSFFRAGENRLDVRILEMEGPRHIEGPTVWRIGIAERRARR